jgi:hypothetical protein
MAHHENSKAPNVGAYGKFAKQQCISDTIIRCFLSYKRNRNQQFPLHKAFQLESG